jgi:DNA-binding beta-propeller fold protein YncE
MSLTTRTVGVVGASVLALTALTTSASASSSFLGSLSTVSTVASTVPANGDVNPYGIAVVPRSRGDLHARSVLISNFNNSSNMQGTGTTIMQISPSGSQSLFARISDKRLPGRCPGGIGLTTALAVLRSGWVVVGSLPTANGSAATAKAGCLLVLDSHGTVRETIAGSRINGPWDMTAIDRGTSADVFVTNVLNGTVAAGGAVVNRGTVVRIALSGLTNRHGRPHAGVPVIIGSGFSEHSDPAALVVGPTGLAFSPRNGTLYVADTVQNRIAAIPQADTRRGSAMSGEDVTAGGSLNQPLGLTLAPNGNLIAANAGDGNAVETTKAGNQVATSLLEPAGAGTLFGLAITPKNNGVYFVDDGDNTLKLLQ